jgi:Arc/MetJ-type ribon-helix-helix transcriptional regulator
MRTSKTLSISLPPAQLKAVEKLARKENRTMSELVREALRRYQQGRTPEYTRGSINTELLAALRAVQEDALRTGLSKMTKHDINAEIAAERREKRAKQIVRQPSK